MGAVPLKGLKGNQRVQLSLREHMVLLKVPLSFALRVRKLSKDEFLSVDHGVMVCVSGHVFKLPHINPAVKSLHEN